MDPTCFCVGKKCFILCKCNIMLLAFHSHRRKLCTTWTVFLNASVMLHCNSHTVGWQKYVCHEIYVLNVKQFVKKMSVCPLRKLEIVWKIVKITSWKRVDKIRSFESLYFCYISITRYLKDTIMFFNTLFGNLKSKIW